MRKKHNNLNEKNSLLIIEKVNLRQKVIFIFSSTTYITIQYITLCQGLIIIVIIVMMICRHPHSYSISISVCEFMSIVSSLSLLLLFNLMIDSPLLFHSCLYFVIFLILILYKHIDNWRLSNVLRLVNRVCLHLIVFCMKRNSISRNNDDNTGVI